MSCSNSDDPNPQNRVRTGREFEKLAGRFFVQQGFDVIERNWQDGHREIDLIVRKDDLVVFVEVKSARSLKFGHPAERVDNRKTTRLTKAAQSFLQEHDLAACDLRFDVVTFVGGQLEHFPNAFPAEE